MLGVPALLLKLRMYFGDDLLFTPLNFYVEGVLDDEGRLSN